MKKTRIRTLLIIAITFIILVISHSSVVYAKGEKNSDPEYEQVDAENSTESESVFGLNPLTIGLIVFILLNVAFFIYIPTSLWLKTISAGIWVWPHTFLSMKLSGADVGLIVENLITAVNGGLKISIHELEALQLARADISTIVHAMTVAHNGNVELNLQDLAQHSLAGGNVDNVVHAIVAATAADLKLAPATKIQLDFKMAAAIDHSGVNLQEAIQNFIKPKVVETDEVVAISKDGIELSAKVRITLRTNFSRLVAGSDDKALIAMVNEAIVSIIGQSENHKYILENAHEVGEKVMRKRDHIVSEAAYDIMSVDVSSIKVGRDINAILRGEQARAKLAEEQAKEQAMKTLAAEARVQHIRAESEVQQAIADAFRDGNISVEEYQKLMNTEADTIMRKAFARKPASEPKEIQ